MFMQNIRRATKKHRKLLLTVVILLMVGLVGSFATWNSSSQVANGTDGSELTLAQQITAYESYVADLLAEHTDPDYSASLTIASSYLDLSYLYYNKYNSDNANIPSLAEPELDENGEEIPLSQEQEAARAAAEAEREEALAAVEKSRNASDEAAQLAEVYYQRALERTPEGLNDAARAEVKAGLAAAREIQGDLEGALAYMAEAYDLYPDNIQYLTAQASLHETLGNLEAALALYEQASALYPGNTQFIISQASVHADLGHEDEARALYQEARALLPEDLTVAYYYASFLFSYESPEAGVAELKAFRDSLPEGHAQIADTDNAIANLEGWASLFAGLSGGGEETGKDGEDAGE